MSRLKRSHEEMQDSKAAVAAAGAAPPPPSPFMPMFHTFRAELDEHHTRREKVIKASRDITAASKKIIFALQRLRVVKAPLPAHVTKNNQPLHAAISAQFTAVSQDLQGLNADRYARQISGGCQEWMEAASFEHYLLTARLLTYEEADAKMRSLDVEGPGVQITPEDYLLGIYDMTGELMRFAITAMATTGSLPTIPAESSDEMSDAAQTAERSVLNDMRHLRSALEALDTGAFGPFAKDCEKKMEVMRSSVDKVEQSLYGLVVRGAERPAGWVPDADGGGRVVEAEA